MKIKIYRRILIAVFLVTAIFTGFYTYEYVYNDIPDEINVFTVEDLEIKTSIPISFKLKENTVEASANGKIADSNVTVADNLYTAKTKIFGFIPSKDVRINVIKINKVIPCGFQIGIYLHTNGVMIIDTGKVTDIEGNSVNPCENIVKANDYIFSLNGEDVNSKSQLIFLINKYGEKDIVLGIRRGNSEISVKVKPVCTGTDEYKIGIWVRDDSQGIGTLTYITEDGRFAALGHGISDVDTGRLLSSVDGMLYKSEIWGIKKGEDGIPGGLLGSISYESENEYGKITENTECGIFGKANSELIKDCKFDAIDIGLKNDIKKGNAKIRCMMGDEISEYDIKINKIDYSNNDRNKGMVIEITDPELLSKTNGIVQGMSGSPIIQNGKIIGAVTHVFVNDPTKGYGIFIENMLEQE